MTFNFSHDIETTQWDHPQMSQLLKNLGNRKTNSAIPAKHI